MTGFGSRHIETGQLEQVGQISQNYTGISAIISTGISAEIFTGIFTGIFTAHLEIQKAS
ncbi:MAG: hypothetical protein OXC46_05000 [Thaumarchaeota archaeon]|nr:hypothetical protein [Nitrososphaerota archaeon]